MSRSRFWEPRRVALCPNILCCSYALTWFRGMSKQT
jgi:hypothetical protein